MLAYRIDDDVHPSITLLDRGIVGAAQGLKKCRRSASKLFFNHDAVRGFNRVKNVGHLRQSDFS